MTRMAIIIPKTGPFIYKVGNLFLDLWYQRSVKCWVVQQKDSDGNQTGPGYDGEALYYASREEAVNALKSIVHDHDTSNG